jgi:hypothetical protein
MIRFVDFPSFAQYCIPLSYLLKFPDGLFKSHNLLCLLLPSEFLLSKLLLQLPVSLLDHSQLFKHGVDALGILGLITDTLKGLSLLCLDSLEVANL